jgi:hypothetical protein
LHARRLHEGVRGHAATVFAAPRQRARPFAEIGEMTSW